jgi:hypothetical protein
MAHKDIIIGRVINVPGMMALRLGRNRLIHFRDCVDPISTGLRP